MNPATTFQVDALAEWADLLDPRPVSLRDECIAALNERVACCTQCEPPSADAVLAVVRRRIEALPDVAMSRDAYRRNVLALFGEVTP
jgi:hypothetical protein